MESVKGTLPVLALAALLVVVPAVPADEPEDAPALWTELYGDEGVESLVFTPATLPEGEHFEATLTFTNEVNVSDVKYQICYIGSGCFAIGVPTIETEPGTWVLDTRDIDEHARFQGDIHFERRPRHDPGDTRVGIQYFVCMEAESPCPEDPLEWRLFPEGRDDCLSVPDEEFKECEETHYFGIEVVPVDRAIPSLGAPPVGIAVLAVVGVLARRR